ncbi:hypothetical protein [Microbulbifer pacificus]|uniref:hypothetical protein n=1 Tax=Microbulbifer pacificus TaxID=407164 RepID=UPI001319C6CF|nr:hypothetical protein [Microbulbifer pacificus]
MSNNSTTGFVLGATCALALMAVATVITGCAGAPVSDAALHAGNPQDTTATASDVPSLNSERQPLDEAVSRRIDDAELVAKVRITGVHRMIDHALSEPGMMAILGYVYSGVAEKVWKGETTRLLAFRLTLDVCNEKLQQGEQYLIFAKSDAQGRLQLESCEAAVADGEAGSLLVQLDRYIQG